MFQYYSHTKQATGWSEIWHAIMIQKQHVCIQSNVCASWARCVHPEKDVWIQSKMCASGGSLHIQSKWAPPMQEKYLLAFIARLVLAQMKIHPYKTKAHNFAIKLLVKIAKTRLKFQRSTTPEQISRKIPTVLVNTMSCIQQGKRT